MKPAHVCLLLLWSMGCHRSSEPTEKPVDVPSVIAGCQTLDECEHQCSSEKPAACVAAGRLYEYGHGVPVDVARAFKLYDRSCTLGYSGGCYNAALLLEAGRGVSKDVRRASQLYASVCQAGSKTACARAEALTAPR